MNNPVGWVNFQVSHLDHRIRAFGFDSSQTSVDPGLKLFVVERF
jgi:hypothetical protein